MTVAQETGKTPFPFRRQEAEEFLDALYEGQEGYWPLATKDPEKGWSEAKTFFEDGGAVLWPADREDVLYYLEKLAPGARMDIYTGLLMHSTEERKKDNALPGSIIWADIDVEKGSFIPERLKHLVAVNASGSPGNFHVYIRLTCPVAPERIEELNQLLIRATGNGDKKWSAETVLRIPGTYSYKKEEPSPVLCIQPLSSAPKQDPDELEELLRSLEPQGEVARPHNGVSISRDELDSLRPASVPDEELHAYLRSLAAEEARPAGERSEQVAHFIRTAIECGLNDAQVYGLSLRHKPSTESKKGDALKGDVLRLIKKHRPAHAHIGRNCIEAECVSRPNWMADNVPAIYEYDSFWESRESLKHIRAVAKASSANEWATLCVCLQSTIYCLPPHYVLPAIVGGETSLNLFVALVGESGDGKGVAMSAARKAFTWPVSIRYSPQATGEGIFGIFKAWDKKESRFIDVTDRGWVNNSEASLLKAVAGRQGATIMSILKQGFMGEAIGQTTADISKRYQLEEQSYRLLFTLGVQPGHADSLFSDQEGGTPQRVLFSPTSLSKRPKLIPECPAPTLWRVPVGNLRPESIEKDSLSIEDRLHYVIPVCSAVKEDVLNARYEDTKGSLDAHSLLVKEKVAVALALLDGRIEISEDDWQLAETVMRISFKERDRVLSRMRDLSHHKNAQRASFEAEREVLKHKKLEEEKAKSEDTQTARVAENLLKHIGATGAEGIPQAELKRKLRSSDRKYYEDAMDLLKEREQVREEKTNSSGGEGVRLFLAAPAQAS